MGKIFDQKEWNKIWDIDANLFESEEVERAYDNEEEEIYDEDAEEEEEE
jgi:hypothetical protein